MKGGNWWPEVMDNSGTGDASYAGAPFTQHDMFYVYGDGVKRYRVHTLEDGWLGWVEKADINDSVNGMAGIFGHTIDGYQIDGDVYYRAQVIDKSGWFDTVHGMTDYAGLYGHASDKVQVWPA